MIQIMLDLETFGNGPTAAIVQLGACRFDLEQPVFPLGVWGSGVPDPHFERTVALQSSLLYGGTIDQDTVAWWRRQSEEARYSVQTGTVRLEQALREFLAWFGDGKDTCLWSHGASFDPPILDHAYRGLGLTVPWRYSLVRDTRTLFELAATLAGWVRPRRQVAHTALADAIAQAEDVRGAWQALKALTNPVAIVGQQSKETS